ncbi:MAG TPA: hypothetical protein DD706_11480 [Nitrospiraceae bacterium]|nr:hypothetical protein [Nitrospiraceae bacterium]
MLLKPRGQGLSGCRYCQNFEPPLDLSFRQDQVLALWLSHKKCVDESLRVVKARLDKKGRLVQGKTFHDGREKRRCHLDKKMRGDRGLFLKARPPEFVEVP